MTASPFGTGGSKRKAETTSNAKVRRHFAAALTCSVMPLSSCFKSKVLEQASDTNLEELLLSAGLSGPSSTKDKKTGGAFAGTSRGPDSQSKARPVTPKV
jgi:hypothetical protein